MSDDIKKAEEAIIKLFNGEHVPPPPRYYDDEGDVLDIMRAAGWVIHAFAEPDYESDNVLGVEFWDCKRSNVVLLARSGEVPSFYDLPTDYTTVIHNCLKMISDIEPGQAMSSDDALFNGLKRHKDVAYAKRFISYMNSRIQDAGGRKEANGEWPRLSSDTLFNVNNLVRSLVSHASHGQMAAMVYDKTDPVRMIAYPANGRTARDRENAIQALEGISGEMKNMAHKARMQDYEVRSKREAEEKRVKAEEDIQRNIRDIHDKYHASLINHGAAGSEVIAKHLNGEARIPVYKFSSKRPNPERDALIDEVESFLGEDAHEITSKLISSDLSRRLKGYEMLSERLGEIFHGPEQNMEM